MFSGFQHCYIISMQLHIYNHLCKILYAFGKLKYTELRPYKIFHQTRMCFSAHQNVCRYYFKKCINVYISVRSGLQLKTLLLKEEHALSRVFESYFITFDSLDCFF